MIARFEAVIYSGIVPVFYLAALLANDRHIRNGANTNNARAMRLLVSGYRSERVEMRSLVTDPHESTWVMRTWASARALVLALICKLRLWWEVLEVVKTLVITSFSCAWLRGTSLQALNALLYQIAHLGLYVVIRPYRRTSNTWFQALCLLVQAFVLMICLLLHVNAAPVLQDDNVLQDNLLKYLSSSGGRRRLSHAFDAALVINAIFFVCCMLYGGFFEEQPIRVLRWVSTDREAPSSPYLPW